LKNTVLCVFANKQDLEEASSVEDISEKLGLSKIKNREWQIFKTSAMEGNGITEGFDWIVETITNKK
jgi:ADP-ribosylation factor-like protein 1